MCLICSRKCLTLVFEAPLIVYHKQEDHRDRYFIYLSRSFVPFFLGLGYMIFRQTRIESINICDDPRLSSVNWIKTFFFFYYYSSASAQLSPPYLIMTAHLGEGESPQAVPIEKKNKIMKWHVRYTGRARVTVTDEKMSLSHTTLWWSECRRRSLLPGALIALAALPYIVLLEPLLAVLWWHHCPSALHCAWPEP